MRSISVIVADTDAAGRVVCRQILEAHADISIIADTLHHDDALRVAAKLNPRILLCSDRLAAKTDYAIFENVRAMCPSTLGLLWTQTIVDDEDVMAALTSGALGVVQGADLSRDLARAIRDLDRGEAWVMRKALATIRERLVS